ncbi:hypothetical protein HY413_01000 [Candidatus Kaiserbacteria bacterium]|nr:hypothetical protein [Candidatus Kaiserbacteria bacterium]
MIIASVCATDVRAVSTLENLNTAPTKNNPVFFAVPDTFDAAKPVRVVVYFHGNLEDETFAHVVERQKLAEQVANANINAVLVAPYFDDSVASHVGTFADTDGFKKFMHEACEQLAALAHVPVETLMRAPIALIAYSGGFGPAKTLFQNDIDIDSVLLLDAHYGSQQAFVDKAAAIAKRKRGVFVSAYSQDTNYRAEQFSEQLKKRDIRFETAVPDVFTPGMIVQQFVQGKDIHFDFVTKAWTRNPITDFLQKTYTARP